MNYILAYDVGTTGVKSCLFGIDGTLVPVGGEYCTYRLYILENGGAEQPATPYIINDGNVNVVIDSDQF